MIAPNPAHPPATGSHEPATAKKQFLHDAAEHVRESCVHVHF
jgi:hypothetical protein